MIQPRRRFLIQAATALVLPAAAQATPEIVAGLIRDFAAEAPLRDGKVTLDLPILVENGNVVSMAITVDTPLGTLRELAVFADGNPLPVVLRVAFGPAAGAPRIATRIRLATSQTVTAIARLADGSCWRDSVELLVTLAACIE